MGKKFTDFVKSLNEEEKKKSSEFNPKERIETFQVLVDSLYNDINGWLEEELQSGAITTGAVPVTIVEEQLGSYQTMNKWIQIGRERIELHPVGTIMIGTNARIDMTCRSKEVMIVRAGENVNGPGSLISVPIVGDGETEPARKRNPGKAVWKYVKKEQRFSYVTLNKESFENLIMELCR